jgi:NADH-quinone oxidoreductase subunit L
VLRRAQTGFVRSYALTLLAGAVLVVVALLVVNLA